MSVRERILTLRLMEKLKIHPAYAEALEIELTAIQPTQADDKKEN